jgi:hypothetical protein
MAWKHPLELIVEQPLHRSLLIRPRMPAICAGCAEPLGVSIPPQMIAGKQKPIAVEQGAMAFGVAGSGDYEKVVGKLNRFEAVDDDFGGGLGVQLVAMNDALSAEMSGEALGVGDVVGMGQEDPRQAAPLLDAAHEAREKLRRIDKPVAVGSANEIAVAAERFRRVHAAEIDIVFDEQREIVEDLAGAASPERADGARRAADESLERAVSLVGAGGLGLHVGIIVGLAEDLRSNLTASITIDARRIDEELSGHIFTNDFARVSHRLRLLLGIVSPKRRQRNGLRANNAASLFRCQ